MSEVRSMLIADDAPDPERGSGWRIHYYVDGRTYFWSPTCPKHSFIMTFSSTTILYLSLKFLPILLPIYIYLFQYDYLEFWIYQPQAHLSAQT